MPTHMESMNQYLDRHMRELSPDQAEVYMGFTGLFDIVHTYHYLGQAYYQQALRCFYRMMLIVGNPPTLAGIKSMEDEFDLENIREDFLNFLTALRRAFAIDQFFRDVEKKFELDGLTEVYGVADTLEETLVSYNDVIRRLEEEKSQKHKDFLSCMKPVSLKECLPTETEKKNARKKFKTIDAFRGKNISIEFYDAYISE